MEAPERRDAKGEAGLELESENVGFAYWPRGNGAWGTAPQENACLRENGVQERRGGLVEEPVEPTSGPTQRSRCPALETGCQRPEDGQVADH